MFKRVFAIGSGALSIAVSCGGSTEKLGPSPSTGGAGGSAAGASSGQFGSSGTAGTAGAAGSADAGGPDCYAEPRSHICGEGGNLFYYDRASSTCRTYGWNQCYDSPNTFPGLAACLAACPDARPSVAACESSSDCVIVDSACCGACEPVSQDSLMAINVQRAQAGDYRDPCPPIACAPCPSVDEVATTRQYFVPICTLGVCGVRDIRVAAEYTRCLSDSDCVLRDGALCCEGCDGRGLVAVNPNTPGPSCEGNPGCPDCAPIIPEEYAAQCQFGRCRVIRSVDGAR